MDLPLIRTHAQSHEAESNGEHHEQIIICGPLCLSHVQLLQEVPDRVG